MKNKIAVIGVSFKFPGADNFEQFHWNLMRKKVSVSEIDDRRFKYVNNPSTDKFRLGYIENIDLFDNSFFDISNREARAMCPEMRLSLTCAAGAIIDAGYSLKNMRGSNCGVIVSQSNTNYELGIAERDAFSFTGNLPAMSDGNIGYYLDLRGPNMTISSACASTLLAIHEATIKLSTGQTDAMLVGGAELARLDKDSVKEVLSSGIMSASGECQPFDKNSRGTASGDGVAFVLLKRYEDALKDNDHIYGCILSSAANGNGSRSGNPTAPSAQAQTEVISKAWKLAGISSDEITEIEAHGTGTVLGDPVEAKGIIDCINEKERQKPIYVTAVKSNIGHLGNLAGMAAFIKVLTGFMYNTVYPIAELKELNPSVISDKLEYVTEPVLLDKSKKRIAGISAFAFNGTNVHVVLENYRNDKSEYSTLNEKNKILKLSVKNEEVFECYLHEIYNTLKNTDVNLNNVVYTLNCGRDDYSYRSCITFSDENELIQKLCSCKLQRIVKNVEFICNNAALKDILSSLGIKFSDSGLRIPENITALSDVVSFCYKNGANIKWHTYYGETTFSRVSLPFNMMLEKHLWYKETDNEKNEILNVDCDNHENRSAKELLLDILRTELNNNAITENDSVFDMGADSVKIIGIMDTLKKYDIVLEIADFYKYETVADIVEYIENGKNTEKNYASDDVTKKCVNDIYTEDIKSTNEMTEGLPIVSENESTEENIKVQKLDLSDKEKLTEIILEICRNGLDDDTITKTDSLFDAGINSMSMMMIIDDLNDYGIEINIEDFYDNETVEDIVNSIRIGL